MDTRVGDQMIDIACQNHLVNAANRFTVMIKKLFDNTALILL